MAMQHTHTHTHTCQVCSSTSVFVLIKTFVEFGEVSVEFHWFHFCQTISIQLVNNAFSAAVLYLASALSIYLIVPDVQDRQRQKHST